MQMIVATNINSTISQTKSFKKYLKFVRECFVLLISGTLMAELTTMKFDGSRTMQNHITEMTNTTARPWTS